jgi:uncharacterized protein YqgV (UPF0045/DUF77 family)
MKVQAEVSIYPLRTKSLSEPIEEFCKILCAHDLETKTTSMSTFIKGESRDLFKACDEAFKKLTKKYQIVMNMKVSNACSLDETK